MNHLKIPALLTDPGHCGTLAAARNLSTRGIQVWTTASSKVAPTSYSRHVHKHWNGAKAFNPDRQLDWLLEFGRLHIGTVLYPTSDDFAWLQAVHAEQLGQYFRMYSPDALSIENVLDKHRLFEACCKVGIDSPTSYFAETLADVASVAQHAEFPLLLKQRTQIFSTTKTKGSLIHHPDNLVSAYDQFVECNRHAPAVLERMPFASRPLMQEFHPDAQKGSYLISGFVNRNHTKIVARAANKVLQYPRTLGIALCMEQAPLDTDLVERILKLCKHTGHFGVFQIEFLTQGNRKLLIDFNPRYYHYMAFDIARGLPLPWFAHLGACGDEQALAEAMAVSQNAAYDTDAVFTYRLQLHELLWAQRLTGTLSHDNYRHWQNWYKESRARMVDAVADSNDRLPEIAATLSTFCSVLRHPRAFIRKIALDR